MTVNSYSIEDVSNRNYAIFKITNAQETGTPVTLEFDPDVIRIDLSDEAYANRIANSESTDSNGYVKKFTYTMDKESSKNIKFYKVDMSKDYTYPSGNNASIVTVKSNSGS